MVLIVALAALIGVLLGLVGGGGSILTMPLLLYAGFETRPAIATSLVIVGLSALAALVPHALAGRVRFRAGAVFGGAGMLGAHLGARVSGFVPELVLLGGFAVMMVLTAVALYRCRRCDGQVAVVTRSESRFRHVRLPLQGFVVGMVTGLIGVGGGFLIVPALTLLAGLPTRAAVATSLFVIALNALAGFTGHLSHVPPDWPSLGPLVLACSLGGLGGSLFADRIPQRILRRGMAVVVLVVALFGVAMKARAAAAPDACLAQPPSLVPASGHERPPPQSAVHAQPFASQAQAEGTQDDDAGTTNDLLKWDMGSPHSYRSASMGSRRAALRAG
jgi:uncharacterized membrane protein YfcA